MILTVFPAFLRRAFLENFALKAVAFVLAVTLFILVRGDRETERTVRVSLAYVRPTDRVLVSDVPAAVDVWVRGPWTRIRRLDPNDVDPIAIDLTKLPDGDFVIDQAQIHLPAGLHVASIRPAKINIQFEHLKRVPVVPEPVGAPAEGYIVERIVLEPPGVSVRGPKGAVEAMTDVRTLPVSIAGKRISFHQQVPLAPLPKGVNADVDSVDVSVSLAEETSSRALHDVPVALQPPAGSRLAADGIDGLLVDPARVTITLRGAEKAVAGVAPGTLSPFVDVRIEDYTPGHSRQAPVRVDGAPAGVAVEVNPRDVMLVMRPGKTP